MSKPETITPDESLAQLRKMVQEVKATASVITTGTRREIDDATVTLLRLGIMLAKSFEKLDTFMSTGTGLPSDWRQS